MPFTDKTGRVWPDTMQQNGVNFILDPVASMAAKRPKYRPDPRERKEYAEKYGFVEKPEEPASAMEGLALTGAGAAALVGGQQLGNYLTSSMGEKAAETGLSEVGKAALTQQTALPGAAEAAAPAVAEAPGLLSGFGGLGILPTAAIAGGTILGGKAAYDMYKGKKPDLPGRVILGMATGGLSEAYNALANRESTRDVTARRTKDLLGQSDDANYQNYVTGMREQYKTAPTGPAYAGQYNTFDEYKKAGLQANDLTGVYGNIKAFGADWANLDQTKREEVTQALINADLYDSKKGDVIIKDEDKAKAIYQGIVGKKQPATTSLAQAGAIARPIVSNQQAFRR